MNRFRNDKEWWEWENYWKGKLRDVAAIESAVPFDVLQAEKLTVEVITEEFGVYVRIASKDSDLAGLKCTGMRVTDVEGRTLAMDRTDVVNDGSRWMIRGRNANSAFHSHPLASIELDLGAAGGSGKATLRLGV